MIKFNLDDTYLKDNKNYTHNLANFYLDNYFKENKDTCYYKNDKDLILNKIIEKKFKDYNIKEYFKSMRLREFSYTIICDFILKTEPFKFKDNLNYLNFSEFYSEDEEQKEKEFLEFLKPKFSEKLIEQYNNNHYYYYSKEELLNNIKYSYSKSEEYNDYYDGTSEKRKDVLSYEFLATLKVNLFDEDKYNYYLNKFYSEYCNSLPHNIIYSHEDKNIIIIVDNVKLTYSDKYDIKEELSYFSLYKHDYQSRNYKQNFLLIKNYIDSGYRGFKMVDCEILDKKNNYIDNYFKFIISKVETDTQFLAESV